MLLPEGSPSVRGRRLAAELRRLRERTGLTGEEVAQELGWSGSKISRIERRKSGVKQSDLDSLLDLYRVEDPYRSELHALARESAEKTWLELATANFPPEQAAYLRAEAEAQSVWSWDPQVVPGLLQTSDYARAVMEGWQSMFALPPGETERRVNIRLTRQKLLTNDPALALSAILDESVLYRRFGDEAVMRQQLERLLESSHLPNVELRVLPLGGKHPIGTGAFFYLEFPRVHEVPLHDIVTVEHLLGSNYLEDEEDTNKFRVTLKHLIAASLDPGGSRDIIRQALERHWS